MTTTCTITTTTTTTTINIITINTTAFTTVSVLKNNNQHNTASLLQAVVNYNYYTRGFNSNGISIDLAVFAQITPECPRT